MSSADRVVLVNGGASTVGAAISRHMARQGANVVIADEDAAAGGAVQASIEEAGFDASYVNVRHGDEDSIQSLAAETVLAYGAVDVLVNCIDDVGGGDALAVTAEDWQLALDRQLRGSWLACKYALPFLRKSPAPAIVNVTLSEALSSAPRRLLATTVRGGVLAMTRSLAVDYGPFGIRVNAVCMGLVEDESRAATVSDAAFEASVRQQPLGRLGRPGEIARVVAFLSSEDASYITGAVIVADGGRSIVAGGL